MKMKLPQFLLTIRIAIGLITCRCLLPVAAQAQSLAQHPITSATWVTKNGEVTAVASSKRIFLLESGGESWGTNSLPWKGEFDHTLDVKAAMVQDNTYSAVTCGANYVGFGNIEFSKGKESRWNWLNLLPSAQPPQPQRPQRPRTTMCSITEITEGGAFIATVEKTFYSPDISQIAMRIFYLSLPTGTVKQIFSQTDLNSTQAYISNSTVNLKELLLLKSNGAHSFALLTQHGEVWTIGLTGYHEAAQPTNPRLLGKFPNFFRSSDPKRQTDDLLPFAFDAKQQKAAAFFDEQFWLLEENSPALKVSVNPCEQDEICGLSLASDGSWMLCGSWGCYLGQEQVYQRLPIAILAGETKNGQLRNKISHSGAGGRYIYLGQTEADWGALPQINRFAGQTTQSLPPRVILWTKTAQPPTADSQLLFPFFLPKSNGSYRKAGFVWIIKTASLASNSQTATTKSSPTSHRYFTLPNGFNLPGALPLHTVALELEHEFPALTEDFTSHSSQIRWKIQRNARDLANPMYAPPIPWHMSIGLPETKTLLNQSGVVLSEVIVALVDSGIDLNHPQFFQKISPASYDFVEEDNEPNDDFGHGTHVAGILASKDYGIAANTSILVAKALDASGKSNSIDLARALAHSRKSGAQIVNCSWGGGFETQVLQDAFHYLKEQGVIVTVSAGNSNLNNDKYPEVPRKFPGITATGALEPNNKKAGFSNYGKTSVLFFAPGVEIESTIPGGIGLKSGTSMASPITAGTFAILLGMNLSPAAASKNLCDASLQASEKKRLNHLLERSVCGKIAPYEAILEVLHKHKD